MPKKPPQRTVKRLLTKDVIKAFGGIRQTADALDNISFQAVHNWQRFIPNVRVWQVLALKPELEAKVIHEPVKYKLVTRKVERYVKA